jgi:hypothetical protein
MNDKPTTMEAVNSRPILFSAPMVRALLAGTKTQTRRIVKLKDQSLPLALGFWEDGDGKCVDKDGPRWSFGHRVPGDPQNMYVHERVMCPYGQPGDRLRVKEQAWMWCEKRPNGKTKTGRAKFLYVPLRAAPVIYCADHTQKPGTSVVSPETGNVWGWRCKVARFMPAWASRITLEITGVRVERLQGISDADAFAKGIQQSVNDGVSGDGTARGAYRALWESINGPGSWDANPWVWVVEFRKATP